MQALICCRLNSSRIRPATTIIILGRRFCPLGGSTVPVNTEGLGHRLWRCVESHSRRTAVEAQPPCRSDAGSCPSHSGRESGIVGLGQLSISHALLRFGQSTEKIAALSQDGLPSFNWHVIFGNLENLSIFHIFKLTSIGFAYCNIDENPRKTCKSSIHAISILKTYFSQ